MALTTYDGGAIFGRAVKVKMLANPSASQISEYFGVGGQQSSYGGSRGRTFLVEGLIFSYDGDPAAQTALILSYDDGIGRVFYHDFWGTWPGVIYRRFEPVKLFWDGSLTYKAQFDGMI